jgi:hypothetical protein
MKQSRCLIKAFCQHYKTYWKIPASNNLIIEGACVDGCDLANSIQYSYVVYKNIGDENNFTWVPLNQNELSYIKGKILQILKFTQIKVIKRQ